MQEKNRVFTFLSALSARSYWVIIVGIHFFWFLALFPGLAQTDAETQINLMRAGESSGQWTGSYFRLLQLFTLDGRVLWLASAAGMIALSYSIYYFTQTFLRLRFTNNLVYLFFVLTPVFGFFSLTVNHEIPFVSGFLLLSALLRNYFKTSKMNLSSLFLALFLITCAFPGYVVVFLILISLLARKRFAASACVIVFSITLALFSFTISSVTPIGNAIKYAPLLGDVKCVVQDPKSKISDKTWEFLNGVAPHQLWIKTDPCYSADFAFFALENLNSETKGLKQAWLQIAADNPLYVLNAHLERARVALPPFFFHAPLNMLNDSEVSRGFPEQISPGMLATAESKLFPPQKNSIQASLRSFVNVGAYILNQRTNFWGWGGMWLFLILIMTAFGLLTYSFELIVGLLGIHVFLILWSPESDSRYVMSSVVTGFLTLIWILLGGLSRNKQNSVA